MTKINGTNAKIFLNGIEVSTDFKNIKNVKMSLCAAQVIDKCNKKDKRC